MTVEQALERTCQLLASSQDSDWTPWSAVELLGQLSNMLEALRRGGEIDKAELRLLFVVTGPVQEISMANGWSAEMLRLAEVVDAFTA